VLNRKKQAQRLRCAVAAAAAHCGYVALDPTVAPAAVAALPRRRASFAPDEVVNWGQPSKLGEELPGDDLVRIFRRPFDAHTLPTE
jgi:hypothetical protein